MRKAHQIVTIVALGIPAAPTGASAAQSVDGDWTGAVSVAGQRLPFTIHITTGTGGLGATIDIQGAMGLPIQNVSHEHPAVRFELAAGPGLAVFAGTHSGDTISGEFTQSGLTGEFTMDRGAPEGEADPPPYGAHEVTFHHGHVTLAGTLTVPEGSGPFPAVVLISGSGPQDRDETIFGMRPFYLIADHFTRRGVAVLRYDDRGVGGSTGDVSRATTEDLAGDVAAAVGLLQSRPEIRADRIGLIGHSEGGVIAPFVAASRDDIAFIVLLAGSAIRGDELLLAQGQAIGHAGGAGPEELQEQAALQRQIFAAMRTDTGWDEVRAAIEGQVRKSLANAPAAQRSGIADEDAFVAQTVEAQVAQVMTPWFRFFIDYDPRQALEKLQVPMLAVFGGKDVQVPAELNRAAMDSVLTAADRDRYTLEVIPEANHLFQRAVTGAVGEYASLPKEFVPELLPMIERWIERQGRQ